MRKSPLKFWQTSTRGFTPRYAGSTRAYPRNERRASYEWRVELSKAPVLLLSPSRSVSRKHPCPRFTRTGRTPNPRSMTKKLLHWPPANGVLGPFWNRKNKKKNWTKRKTDVPLATVSGRRNTSVGVGNVVQYTRKTASWWHDDTNTRRTTKNPPRIRLSW